MSYNRRYQPQEKLDDAARRRAAERLKDEGNTAYKAENYVQAEELYSKAIDMSPAEPAYLTNRAAAYMALKNYTLALADCQRAASLQSMSPSAKTLTRLARCQLALGSLTDALSSLCFVLVFDPGNTSALQEKFKIETLELHLFYYKNAKAKKEWGIAQLALDKCLETRGYEGYDIPIEWRIWQIEMKLAECDLDSAYMLANNIWELAADSAEVLTMRSLVLFLSDKLSQSLMDVIQALRLDPGCEVASELFRRVQEVEKLRYDASWAFKEGFFESAITKYDEALALIGKKDEECNGGRIRATLLSKRAVTLVELDRHQEALADADQSLILYPSHLEALRSRARIYLHLGKYEASVTDFKLAFKHAVELQSSAGDVQSLHTELRYAEDMMKRNELRTMFGREFT